MIGAEIYHKLKEKYHFKSILFCPYKQEMFDSMQTVYEEAMKDKEVQACLMPIPYYNLYHLMPIGLNVEFGRLNFPEALQRRWDVIVHHYPYDTKNSITRPLITTNVLKCFCDKLVLINYYITDNPNVDETHWLLSGVTNSDLAICGSEEQKNNVQKIFDKYNVKSTELVAWGSPKFDKRTTRIPKEWKEKKKGRKVILLQTSVIPYMTDVQKIHKIEKFVDEHKECILWRPHPLYIETIKSIRPDDLEVFERIYNKVDIFDDTCDYQNAFEFCDEMYSDGSSIDIVFKRTQKPLYRLE